MDILEQKYLLNVTGSYLKLMSIQPGTREYTRKTGRRKERKKYNQITDNNITMGKQREETFSAFSPGVCRLQYCTFLTLHLCSALVSFTSHDCREIQGIVQTDGRK